MQWHTDCAVLDSTNRATVRIELVSDTVGAVHNRAGAAPELSESPRQGLGRRAALQVGMLIGLFSLNPDPPKRMPWCFRTGV